MKRAFFYSNKLTGYNLYLALVLGALMALLTGCNASKANSPTLSTQVDSFSSGQDRGISQVSKPRRERPSIPTDIITLLFRKEEANAPKRTDTVSLAAAAALENAFLGQGYKIPPVSPEVLKKLDRSQGEIICFAPDAGFSMTYSIYTTIRPDSGLNTFAAEVTLRARVFVGASVLAVENGRGTLRFRAANQQQRQYGEREAMDKAAERAAKSLAKKVNTRLKSLSPAQIAAYVGLGEAPSQEIYTNSAGAVSTEAAPTSDTTETALVETPPASDTIGVPPASGVAPLPIPAQTHVLVVGVSDYANASRLSKIHINNLNGVNIDMENIAHTFAELNISPDRVKVLKNKNATTAKVQSAIQGMAQAAGPDDLLVLYISGHGLQADAKREGMSLPVFYDFALSQRESAPDFAELLEHLTQSAASRYIMIVDTCHSGGAASILPVIVFSSRGIKLSQAKGAPSPGMLVRELDTARNIAVLSSSRVEELSWEDSKGGGLFTSYLAKGLKEAPEGEVLRDIVEKRVAKPVIQESKEKCSRRPRECPTGQQTPTLGFSGGGDMIRL